MRALAIGSIFVLVLFVASLLGTYVVERVDSAFRERANISGEYRRCGIDVEWYTRRYVDVC